MSNEMSGKLDFEKTKKHLFAGNSILTFKNNGTGKHFTFKVKKAKEGDLYFVSFLSGPDNDHNYRYLGIISNKKYFKLTKASKVGQESVVYKAFSWIFDKLSSNVLFPNDLEIWHSGVCGRCGRTLTHPESIETGIGPVCQKLMK